MACPTCGKDLTYIPQYDRFYCYACGNYAPRGYNASGPAIQLGGAAQDPHEGHYHCPSCGKELTYIPQYRRYYCYAEGKYAPKDIQPVIGARGKAEPVLTEEPKATEPTIVEEKAPEPEPVAASEPEVPPEVAEPVVAPASPEPVAEPPKIAEPTPGAEPVAVSPPAEKPARPKLTKNQVIRAKKVQLEGWSRAYGLDATGTRNALRDRLLAFLTELQGEEKYKPEAPEVAPPVAAPEAVALPAPAPAPPEPVVEEPKPEAAPEPAARASEVVAEEPKREPEVVEPAKVEAPTKAEAPAAAPKRAEAPPVEAAPPAPVVEPPVGNAPPRGAEAPAVVESEPVVGPVVAPAPPPVPRVTPVEVAKPLPCPKCGKELTYIAQYDRLYCFSCGNYAPKGYGREPAPVVEEKPALSVVTPKVKAEKKAEHPCPTCGRELTYIKEYDRWYCYAEKKYAPKKVKNPCPTCGEELTFIKEYDRWYCYGERKYAPKSYAAATSAVATAPAPVGTAPAVEVASKPAGAAAEVVPAKAVKIVPHGEHAHGRPGIGIGLLATGFGFVLISRLLQLLGALRVIDPADLQRLPAFVTPTLESLGILLAVIGIAVGMRALATR